MPDESEIIGNFGPTALLVGGVIIAVAVVYRIVAEPVSKVFNVALAFAKMKGKIRDSEKAIDDLNTGLDALRSEMDARFEKAEASRKGIHDDIDLVRNELSELRGTVSALSDQFDSHFNTLIAAVMAKERPANDRGERPAVDQVKETGS